uniref:Glutamyl-tRNA(Gln) amidotransferase subunit C, mitochondrial n=1 Tax=Ornithodoros turicata TaxID=34597 RepID=A0A2R5LDV8_9ACAR
MFRRCLSTVGRHVSAAQSKLARETGKSAVPSSPVAQATADAEPVKLDQDTVELLERLSLVDFSNAEAVVRLEEAINFASAILAVDTTNVEPMITPLENVPLRLRDDVAVQCSAEDILKNAKKTVEGYFVAPPGNIPLDIKADYGLERRNNTNTNSDKNQQT